MLPRRTPCVAVVAGFTAILVAGCATNPPSAAPSSGPSAAVSSISREKQIPYESANDLNRPGTLDVFWPVQRGPWPVVVMFHGQPMVSGNVEPFAERVAPLGFVVFAPNWGQRGNDADDTLSLGQSEASLSQAACAVAFARDHAADYGGDASRLFLFGHSAGANVAAVLAFVEHEPTDGCLIESPVSEATSPVEAVVGLDGDWLLGSPIWDEPVAAEPALLTTWTPWDHFANHPDLPVHLLASSDPGLGESPDTLLEGRDPSGVFRATLEEIGALEDDYVGLDEMQAMASAVLASMGHPTTFRILPDSTHIMFSDAGYEVLVGLFAELQD